MIINKIWKLNDNFIYRVLKINLICKFNKIFVFYFISIIFLMILWQDSCPIISCRIDYKSCVQRACVEEVRAAVSECWSLQQQWSQSVLGVWLGAEWWVSGRHLDCDKWTNTQIILNKHHSSTHMKQDWTLIWAKNILKLFSVGQNKKLYVLRRVIPMT